MTDIYAVRTHHLGTTSEFCCFKHRANALQWLIVLPSKVGGLKIGLGNFVNYSLSEVAIATYKYRIDDSIVT